MDLRIPHFTRDERESAGRCFMTIYLTTLQLEGLVVIGIASWMLSGLQMTCAFALQYYTEIYMCMISGGLLVVVPICGHVFVRRHQTEVVAGKLIFIGVIVFILQFAASILATVHRDKILNDVILTDMKEAMLSYTTSASSKECFDGIQPHFKCCGLLGPDDWKNSSFTVIKNTSHHSILPDGVIPSSCECDKVLYIEDENCRNHNETLNYVYHESCYILMEKHVMAHLDLIRIFCPVLTTIQGIHMLVTVFLIAKFINTAIVDVYKVTQ